jgi:hypothetical protein
MIGSGDAGQLAGVITPIKGGAAADRDRLSPSVVDCLSGGPRLLSGAFGATRRCSSWVSKTVRKGPRDEPGTQPARLLEA